MSPVSFIEPLSLTFLAAGIVAILRYVWLDSGRFNEIGSETADSSILSRATVQRVAMQAEAARVAAETVDLPRAA
jgi:hypothetical protein